MSVGNNKASLPNKSKAKTNEVIQKNTNIPENIRVQAVNRESSHTVSSYLYIQSLDA